MIKSVILDYYDLVASEEHHRYKSWEHCYEYFKNCPDIISDEWKETAQLHLAFYLASWGMYRGSSFLLQRDYKIHQYAVTIMLEKKYGVLWNEMSFRNLRMLEEVRDRVIDAYVQNVTIINGERININITDTLITKILLGVYGCVPAYDRYLKYGMKYFGITGSFTIKSMVELLSFIECFKEQFDEMKLITESNGLTYTNMKLLDMFFWQIGYWYDTEDVLSDQKEEMLNSIRNAFISFNNEMITSKAFVRDSEPVIKKKYSISVIDMVREAAASFEGEFSVGDIKNYIHTRYGDVHDATINAQTIVATVNAPSRVNWAVNQNDRMCDGKYDFLYKCGRGIYTNFNSDIHGNWCIRHIDGDYKVLRVER